MRILLDECIDRRLATDFIDYEVKTVPQMGWAGIKNGQLLNLAQREFNVFITVDRNLSFQQNLSNFILAIIVLKVSSNRLLNLKPLIPKIIAVLPIVAEGEVLLVSETS